MSPAVLGEQNQQRSGSLNPVELCEFAAKGLVPMLDPQSRIFCDICVRSGDGIARTGLSPRYTMMTLLGLHRYEQAGNRAGLSSQEIFDTLVRETGWISCAGDLGLLLWTCAELAPERLPEIYTKIRAESALARFPDAQQGRTMEMAWFLTGAATCMLAGFAALPGLAEQARTARRILERNSGTFGMYGHVGNAYFPTSYLRHHIGSFADQVYPAIAFARLTRALKDEDARQSALRTAQAMCERQGEMGEWFWQYDAKTGRVVSRYPVFSVHQHAMAPMMLFEVAEATGCDFRANIDRGLEWIAGNNELGRDLVDPALKLVWRCIHLGRRAAYADAALRFFGLRQGPANPHSLRIRYECRPYELGWLLYAFAGR
ncbi:MAG: hypothetical protein KGN79_01640 [Acidobacteriota bacterium]|nr:hypothetical protein [Acidobacteriota bacterium]